MNENLNERLAELLEVKPQPPTRTKQFWQWDGDPQWWGLIVNVDEAHWEGQPFLTDDAYCFRAVDEMARRGWQLSLHSPRPNDPIWYADLEHSRIGNPDVGEMFLVVEGQASTRREALVKGMIAALKAK